MTVGPNLKQALQRSRGEPVRLEDPETRITSMVVREDVFR
jgi:hypothetical protein